MAHLDNEVQDVAEAAHANAGAAELRDQYMHLFQHGRVVLGVIARNGEDLCNQLVCASVAKRMQTDVPSPRRQTT